MAKIINNVTCSFLDNAKGILHTEPRERVTLFYVLGDSGQKILDERHDAIR